MRALLFLLVALLAGVGPYVWWRTGGRARAVAEEALARVAAERRRVSAYLQRRVPPDEETLERWDRALAERESELRAFAEAASQGPSGQEEVSRMLEEAGVARPVVRAALAGARDPVTLGLLGSVARALGEVGGLRIERLAVKRGEGQPDPRTALEIEAVGPGDRLLRFVDGLLAGPPAALFRRVRIESPPPEDWPLLEHGNASPPLRLRLSLHPIVGEEP